MKRTTRHSTKSKVLQYRRLASVSLFYVAVSLLFAPSSESRPMIEHKNGGDKGALTVVQPSVSLRSTVVETPFVDLVMHDINNLILSVKSTGQIGPDMYQGSGLNGISGMMQYPRGTSAIYPTPRLVVGGILGKDTLVTEATEVSTEWWPGTLESQIINDELIRIIGINDTGAIAELARSEQDIRVIYYDTLSDAGFTGQDALDNRPHRPLYLRVEQTSYAWSFEFAEDFILIDYDIRNIGTETIKDAYLGLKMRGGYDLEIVSGYLDSAEAVSLRPTACEYVDSVALYWSADSDGNPVDSGFDLSSASSVVAVKILRKPAAATGVNWNWFDDDIPNDWGPRKIPAGRALRNYGGLNGVPIGDRNTYDMMSNGEVDYDQFYTAIDSSSSGWIPPSNLAPSIAAGPGWGGHNHHHSFVTVGPFDIPVGTSVPLTIAYIAGERFHRNGDKVFQPTNPGPYYNELFFDDLLVNSAWANWVFDNPGIDSDPSDDNDYRGEYRICYSDSTISYDSTIESIDSLVNPPETLWIVDTLIEFTDGEKIYYTGDGIPDFRAAGPPPAPKVRFFPSKSEIVVEWNGLESETTPDVFTGELDFEGYRVYLGLLARRGEMIVQVSYDRENYTQRYFRSSSNTWIVLRKPFKLQEARDAYANGSTDWHPLIHDIDHPLHVGDSIFYFVPQDWNQDDLTLPDGIQKIYPDAPYPHTIEIDSAFIDELTPDGKYFKYFEYKYVLRNLLPSVPYYVSVTAFDYGSQAASLPFLETNPVTNAVEMFALDRVSQSSEELNVIVYPNPYRGDGVYREIGYEGRGEELRPDERIRTVNFANLPPRCTIRIFSLDGDLVDQFEHDQPPDSPTAMHTTWDLLTRNTQLAVSGIYYWVVETPEGRSQIGKLVLIM